jgi:hypothetical protein
MGRLIKLAVLGAMVYGVITYWQPVGVDILSGFTGWRFKSNFARQEKIEIEMNIDEWAWQFGGQAGLERLGQIIRNPVVKDPARELAQTIHDRIQNGDHLPHLHRMIEVRDGIRRDRSIHVPKWPVSRLIEYIYEQDSLEE